jgi:hypothetical protein
MLGVLVKQNVLSGLQKKLDSKNKRLQHYQQRAYYITASARIKAANFLIETATEWRISASYKVARLNYCSVIRAI